jgi:hypothetical protein
VSVDLQERLPDIPHEVLPEIPIEQRLREALAAARAAGTTAAALDAFCTTLGWQEELDDRALTTDEQVTLRRDVSRASYALSEIGLAAQPRSYRCAAEGVVALRTVCEWIDVVAVAAEALPEARAWISPWLARAEQIASRLLPLLAERPLVEMASATSPRTPSART